MAGSVGIEKSSSGEERFPSGNWALGVDTPRNYLKWSSIV
jgi:hypothetical protein